MKKRWYIGVFFGMAAVLAGCAREHEGTDETEVLLEPAGMTSSTVRVEKKDVIDADYELGYVIPVTHSLSFEIDGTVSLCEIHAGDQVSKDQELAMLDSTALDEELTRLNEEYERLTQQYALLNAQWDEETAKLQEELTALSPDTQKAELLQLSIDERIYEHGKELEEQERTLETIKAQYDEKSETAAKIHLLSPCDGIVMSAEIQPGTEVYAGVCVVVIGDYSDGRIACNTFYDEDHIKGLAADVTAYIEDESFTLQYISSYTREEIRRATGGDGVVDLPSIFSFDMQEAGVQIGDVVAIQLVNEMAPDALCVRKDAVYWSADGYYLYKDVDGARYRVDVEVGLNNGMEIEILEGDLQEGDEVYVQE